MEVSECGLRWLLQLLHGRLVGGCQQLSEVTACQVDADGHLCHSCHCCHPLLLSGTIQATCCSLLHTYVGELSVNCLVWQLESCLT